MSSTAAASSAHGATGEARDEDAEEGNDGIDNGLEDSANARDDGHDALSDGAEESGDLEQVLARCTAEVTMGMRVMAYTRDDGTHFEKVASMS